MVRVHCKNNVCGFSELPTNIKYWKSETVTAKEKQRNAVVAQILRETESCNLKAMHIRLSYDTHSRIFHTRLF